MAKAHVKKGDEVVVIAGVGTGQARQDHLLVNKKKQRVLVEGLQDDQAPHRKNQTSIRRARIVEREGTIHISNVMLAAKFDARAAERAPAPPPAESDRPQPEASLDT